jgi:hypothetical protein
MVPDLRERQEDSARAKKALLEKFRAAPGPEDPAVAERRAAREALLGEVELGQQAARAAERAAQAEREAVEMKARTAAERAEREAAVLVEQKAARDKRYAARKAVKKRRGKT